MTLNPNQTPTPIASACHCGAAGVVTVGVRARDHGAYCLEHLDDAIWAIEQIRLADEVER